MSEVWTETVMAEGNMQKPSINIVLVKNPELDEFADEEAFAADEAAQAAAEAPTQ